MPGACDWFISDAERANHATGLLAWTEGNDVRPLVHGETYFARLVMPPDVAARGHPAVSGRIASSLRRGGSDGWPHPPTACCSTPAGKR